MRKPLLVLLSLGLVAGIASAQEYEGIPLRTEKTFSLGSIQTVSPAVLTQEYSNVTTFLGQGVAAGGAALQAGNTITRLIADDCTPTGVNAGDDITEFKFALVNLNAVSVTFRPRVRFWNADGAGGAPGTYYSVPAAIGFTFNPVTMGAGSATVFTATIAFPTVFTMPGGTLWAGVTFDNNTGGTGATAAQLNNLGQAIFNPPAVGSSADQYFRTTAAGSHFGAANPAGSLLNFAGNPPANFGWQFTVDAPVPTEDSSWSRIKAQYAN